MITDLTLRKQLQYMARQQFLRWHEMEKFLILDTETTGTKENAEMCSIAIIDQDGNAIVSTKLKPVHPIPQSATRIHGITNEAVRNKKTVPEIADRLYEILEGHHVLAYNAKFDYRIIQQSFAAYGMVFEPVDTLFEDVMKTYADFHGEWNDYHKSNKWQQLSKACEQQGVTVENAHHALGDCKMTLALIRKIGIELRHEINNES